MKTTKKTTKKKTRGERKSLATLYDERDRAVERVVALWRKSEDVNSALDVLTLAHTAVTFRFVGG